MARTQAIAEKLFMLQTGTMNAGDYFVPFGQSRGALDVENWIRTGGRFRVRSVVNAGFRLKPDRQTPPAWIMFTDGEAVLRATAYSVSNIDAA